MAPAHRVVKRNQRGYHKFKNGQFNVTPKGLEIAIPRCAAKNARDSPHLAIPAEVRTMIWEYALCNYPVNAHYKHRWELPAHPTDMCQPLRVCRQIYSEAAILPYKLNAFTFSNVADIKPYLARSRPNLIQHVRVGVWRASYNHHNFSKRIAPLEKLKGLKILEITVVTERVLTDEEQEGVKEEVATRVSGEVSVRVSFTENLHAWNEVWENF